MNLPNGWRSVYDALGNPEAFIEWLNVTVAPNHLKKQFYPGNLPLHRGMAVCISTDGKVYPYTTANDTKYVGLVDVNALICSIITFGVLLVQGSGWQKGVAYYAQDGGNLSSVETSRFVGVGIDNDRILLMPSGGTGGVAPSGDNNIDGGFANSVYLTSQNLDGGGA